MKKIITIAIASAFSTLATAHGNVDLSNGSQIDVYMVNEFEVHDGHDDRGEGYGIEAIYMHESGYFIYGEGEKGPHDFYQIGAGKYFNVDEKLGMFVYGAYASGAYNGGDEARLRIGADYQVSHAFAVHAYAGYDYGTNKMDASDDHDHDHDHRSIEGDKERSQVTRLDLGFSHELGHSAEFNFNYVAQKQLEHELVIDNDTNLHYEARIVYTASDLKPYVEYRKTNKAFDTLNFEESAVQFGLTFSF